MEDGEPAYAFGYPLGEVAIGGDSTHFIGEQSLCPRVTSTIISSSVDRTSIAMSNSDPKLYVLDKALNYGNSGGPIVASETGHVHAVCSRFQAVDILQPNWANSTSSREEAFVSVPSLYGIASRLDNPELLAIYYGLGIPVTAL